MPVRKTMMVAAREFHENVRTKGFWIGILFLPALMAVAIIAPIWLGNMKGARAYAIVDASGWLGDAVDARAAREDVQRALATALERRRQGGPRLERIPGPLARAAGEAERTGGEPSAATRQALQRWWADVPPREAKAYGARLSRARFRRVAVDPNTDLDALNRRVAAGELFAYFVVPADPLDDGALVRYVSQNITDEELRTWFTRLASAEIRDRRIRAESVAPEVARWIQHTLPVDVTRLDDAGREADVEDDDFLRAWAPAGFTYALWMAVFALSQGLLMSTIEEKSNRVIEVLLSSVSPRQLMAGKILGVMSTGLVTIAVWAVGFIVLATFLPPLLDRGLGLGPVDVDLAAVASEPAYLVSFVGYFLLAYLFYATLLVGIGSLCNTVQESQNLMTPVMLMMMVPLLAVTTLPEDPDGTLARVLSYVPPFTPFVMMGRAAARPPALEYVATSALLLVSIAALFAATVRVFRSAILKTDRRPPMREVLRWVRER